MRLSLPRVAFWVVLMFPALQYLQFLDALPRFNSTLVYQVLVVLLALRLGLGWLYRREWGSRPSAALSAGALGLMVALQLVWLPEFLRHGAYDVYQSNFALTALIPACLLLTGLSAAREDFSARFYGLIFAAYALAVSAGVLINFRETGLTVIKFVNYASSEHFNYLNLADMFAVVAVLLLSRLTRRPLLYFLTFAASLAILTATFSRTSLLLFVIVFALQLALNRSLRWAGLLVILLTSGLSVAAFSSIQNSENYIRLATLLTDPATDSSFVGRSDIAANRLAEIGGHFWTGQYMAEWWSYGERGGYLHNILSYFDSYGVIVFLLLLLTLAVAARDARHSPQQAALLLVYAVLAVLFSRSYVWPYLWLAVGLVAGSPGRQAALATPEMPVPADDFGEDGPRGQPA